MKRRKEEDPNNNSSRKEEKTESLVALLSQERWDDALQRIRADPSSLENAPDPTPLALACRSGAPYECVAALLETCPKHLRRVLDSRGTPLHEAIVCENTETSVIELLLKKDEEMQGDRATLLQDVDGFTPLHLLIRRRFQTHILQEDTNLLQILDLLVRSCPDAVIVPDRGEYEEPPIVYAIKANVYAPVLGFEDDNRVERQIYEMVDCMLRYNPAAAGRVFTGFRGQYTALHSAVFHGRCTDTIELILSSETASLTSPNQQKAALLQNTQGEIPLHFCAMRGERPRTVAVIADAAPEGVLKKDSSGLTPLHWLWIRFVSTLLTLEDGGRGTDATITLPARRPLPSMEISRYAEFAILEQGDFDADSQLIKRMDPSIDFLRMRHIPVEVLADADCLRRASRSVDILRRIREQHFVAINTNSDEMVEWTREEVVTAFFWSKVVSLLQSANKAAAVPFVGENTLLHIAMSSKCCPSWVCHMVAQMYPEELLHRDSRGRFPLHCAASRSWDRWDWPCLDVPMSDSTATKLLLYDSLRILKSALDLTPRQVLRIVDNDHRLVLHHAIDTIVTANSLMNRSMQDDPFEDMLLVMRNIVSMNPDALHCRDGVTMLYPFQQAAAMATANHSEHANVRCDRFPLCLTYELLRESPTILEIARGN